MWVGCFRGEGREEGATARPTITHARCFLYRPPPPAFSPPPRQSINQTRTVLVLRAVRDGHKVDGRHAVRRREVQARHDVQDVQLHARAVEVLDREIKRAVAALGVVDGDKQHAARCCCRRVGRAVAAGRHCGFAGTSVVLRW